MTFKLSGNIKVGQQIKTVDGWRKILSINQDGAIIKDGTVKFGELIYGWKAA